MADKFLVVLSVLMMLVALSGLVYGNYEAWTRDHDLKGDRVDCIDGKNNEIINADTICIKKHGPSTQLEASIQTSFLITLIFGLCLAMSFLFFYFARSMR